VDNRPQLSPGFKFNDWEMRGVPIRLELGPRDLADGSALMSTRLGEGKSSVSLVSAPARLEFELASFQAMLLQRATDFRDSNTHTVNSWGEFTEAVKAGWALALHCGQPECEDDIKSETSATPRCIPAEGAHEEGLCVRCNLPSGYGKRLIFGRAY
jgi:prolyl-tRNA synthetase